MGGAVGGFASPEGGEGGFAVCAGMVAFVAWAMAEGVVDGGGRASRRGAVDVRNG